MIKYVTISKFEELTGYTEAAVRTKIRDGIWLENLVFKYAPDNRILIIIEGYNSWVESAKVGGVPQKQVMKSPLALNQFVVANASKLSPAPLMTNG